MQASMERLGAEVTYYDERCIETSLDKALLKIVPSIFNNKTKKYYDNITKKCEGVYFDYIYFYGADMINTEILMKIKKNIKHKKMVMYFADSVKGIKKYDDMMPIIDKLCTFDRGDYEYYHQKNPNVEFLPLFYSKEYRVEKNSKKQNEKYGLVFVGTIHSDRLEFLEAIKKQAEAMGLRVCFYYYLQARFMYYYRWILDKHFRKKKLSDFRYKKVSAQQVSKLISHSKCVVDAQYPKNKGLTMRTFETLGMRKKLITTNKEIKNYDFYDPNNILIVDRVNPQIDASFFDTEYCDIPEDIYNKYDVDSWTLNLLS